MNESLFNNIVIVQHMGKIIQYIMGKIIQYIMGKIIQYIMGKIIQYNFMFGELLLLLKGHSRSHVTCKALCPFQTKT